MRSTFRLLFYINRQKNQKDREVSGNGTHHP